MDSHRFIAIADQINYRFSFCYPYQKPTMPTRWYHDSTAIRGQRKFFRAFLKDRSYFIMPGYGCLKLDFLGGFHGDGTINIKEKFLWRGESQDGQIKFNSGLYYGEKYEHIDLNKENPATKVLLRYRPQHILFRSCVTKKTHIIFLDWENSDNTSHYEVIVGNHLEAQVKFIIGVAYAQYLELEYILKYLQDSLDSELVLSPEAFDIFSLGNHPYRLKPVHYFDVNGK